MSVAEILELAFAIIATVVPILIIFGLLKLSFALRALFLRVELLEQRERLRDAVHDVEKNKGDNDGKKSILR